MVLITESPHFHIAESHPIFMIARVVVIFTPILPNEI